MHGPHFEELSVTAVFLKLQPVSELPGGLAKAQATDSVVWSGA